MEANTLQANKKYLIINTEDRNPTVFDQYYTNLGLIDFNPKDETFWDETDTYELFPTWWLEEVEEEDSSELWRILLKVTDLLELIGKKTGNETPLTLADARKTISKYANEFLNKK